MITESPRIYVEPWPSGGWSVRCKGVARPLSRHDTEEEAQQRAVVYVRMLTNEQQTMFDEEDTRRG